MNRATSLLLLTAAISYAQVSFDRILNSSKEPQNWLTYSGDYSGHRFSTLDQINVDNVKSLWPSGCIKRAQPESLRLRR
jgi:glucose dehydrogenase